MNPGTKKSKKRIELEKTNLTKELSFNLTLLQLAEKHNTTKDMIHVVLTNQLNYKQRNAEYLRLNPLDSGYESKMLSNKSCGAWMKSSEKAYLINNRN